MTHPHRLIVPALFSLLLITSAARAVTPEPAKAAGGALQADLIFQIDDAQKKIMALEDAIPQGKFSWRPMAGVRSVSEVFAHIAFGNYLLTKVATGKEPPAEAGWEMNPDKWDKRTTDKAALKTMLEASFDHVHASVKAFPDADLDKKVNFFGHEMTARAVLIGLVGHLNEHLGQSIAYARSNKIVPPWSKPAGKEAGHDMPKEGAKAPAAPAAGKPAK
jgi:uncharacterized damage-inducible protein DinB